MFDVRRGGVDKKVTKTHAVPGCVGKGTRITRYASCRLVCKYRLSKHITSIVKGDYAPAHLNKADS